jgi:hypothetical protein
MINQQNDVIVLWAVLNNDVIAQLKTVDDYDSSITPIIEAFARSLEKEGTEIYHEGNTFLVTEKEIYIGVYEDEWNDDDETTNIPVYEN